MSATKTQIRSDEITRKLRERIFSGELEAGMHLVELDIAKEFQVSRGPVRKALQELEYEGLVLSEANKGCTIARLSGEDAYEIFYLRGMLEKAALEKCGGRLKDASLIAMHSLIESMEAEENGEDRLEVLIGLDERFHEFIIRSGQMNRLYQLWKYLSPLNGAMFLKVLQYYKEQEEKAEADPGLPIRKRRKVSVLHKDMLEILEKGDLASSLKMLKEHYTNTGEMLFRWEWEKQHK